MNGMVLSGDVIATCRGIMYPLALSHRIAFTTQQGRTGFSGPLNERCGCGGNCIWMAPTSSFKVARLFMRRWLWVGPGFARPPLERNVEFVVSRSLWAQGFRSHGIL